VSAAVVSAVADVSVVALDDDVSLLDDDVSLLDDDVSVEAELPQPVIRPATSVVAITRLTIFFFMLFPPFLKIYLVIII
jgi:hypothetical protein